MRAAPPPIRLVLKATCAKCDGPFIGKPICSLQRLHIKPGRIPSSTEPRRYGSPKRVRMEARRRAMCWHHAAAMATMLALTMEAFSWKVFCSALGRTRTCDLLIRSDRFGGLVDSHGVPFGPYLRAFRKGRTSLDPYRSLWTRAHKW
jgi:hypothetical protein